MIGKEDLSVTAYEEGYLSADAFYHSPVPLPENPYPPGPWRPFRSWRKGWEDYHAERKGENMVTVTVTKRAWIRNNVPPGTSAPGHISCPCGQAPESRHTPKQGDVDCPCGTIYTWNGWVKETNRHSEKEGE